MNLENITTNPIKNSINPELMFEAKFSIQLGSEIPIEITGSLLSSEGEKLANIYNNSYKLQHESEKLKLSAREDNNREITNRTINIELIASLNCRVLDRIQFLRKKEQKGDVILNLDLYVKTLESRARLSSIFLTDPNNFGSQNITYDYQKRDSYPRNHVDMWILSGDSSSVFIEMNNRNFKKKITIPGSDWVHDFCPVFQIGNFYVFEYFMPDYKEGSESIEERLKKSIDAIESMRNEMIKGEWERVIEESRPVWELLKKVEEIKTLLIDNGYTQQAYDDLNKSIENLYSYSSKFFHKLEKDKKTLMSDIKASKEDAEFIYAMSITLVNLISKKMQKSKL